MSRRRTRHVLRAAAFVLVVLATSVAVLEVAVRLAGLAPRVPNLAGYVRDDHLLYRQQPRSRQVVRMSSPRGDVEIEYRHNSSGFRDVDHERANPAGVFRIVVLGDSFTYGVGASSDETWAAQLARRLEAHGNRRTVEVINLGMPRYFPAAEKLMLEVEGLAYQPDLVLVGVLPNDIHDSRSGLGAVQVSSGGYLVSHRLGPVAEWISLHSHLGRVLLVRLARWLERAHAAEAASEGDWESMQTDLAAMAEMAAQQDARFAIIGIPQSDYGGEAELDRRLIPWSARESIAYISAWPAMRAADGSTPLYWEEGHCTPAGYAVIAQAAYEGLVQHGFIP